MLPNGALYSTFMLLLRAHHCARGRPGSGPACQAFDEVTLHSETQPRRLGNANGSAARYFHLGLDDVFCPISLASRDVSGQSETRLRRHGDVMSPADARFQHASAPYRDPVLTADIMDLPGAGMPAHTPQLDVDNPAGPQFDCRLCMPRIGDAFIQTNGGVDQRLQFCVAMDLVPLQRLLHHEEVKFIQLF